MRWLGLALVNLILAGCAPHEPRAGDVLAIPGDPVQGQALFQGLCARCHHAEGWSYIRAWFGPSGIVSVMIDGAGAGKMPSFAGRSDQELADLYASTSEP